VQVSRRKDGQRFKVFVEPAAGAKSGLKGVFSGPICVMSKRKTGERVVARQIKEESGAVVGAGGDSDPESVDVPKSLMLLSTEITAVNRKLEVLRASAEEQVCVRCGPLLTLPRTTFLACCTYRMLASQQ
jgi:hypothetical protein